MPTVIRSSTGNSAKGTISARLLIALVRAVGGASLLLFGTFLFLGPFGVFRAGLSSGEILAWDAALCLAFCVQHSVMVRRGFRRRVEGIVPPHLHGALYTVSSAAVLSALVLLWQESPVVVLRLEGAGRWLARAVFLAALPGFWWSLRSLGRFDLFGIGPIRDRIRGREPRRWPLTVRGPYRWVRHPLYFLVLVLVWSHPDLTADRLLLDGMLTVWIVLGAVLEERDLMEHFGADYAEYRRHVPMLLPWRW